MESVNKKENAKILLFKILRVDFHFVTLKSDNICVFFFFFS